MVARLHPDLASSLEANRREFLARVETQFRRWREMLAPYRGARVVSYHDSWPYFYRAYDLIELGVIEDRPERPAPHSVMNMAALSLPRGSADEYPSAQPSAHGSARSWHCSLSIPGPLCHAGSS